MVLKGNTMQHPLRTYTGGEFAKYFGEGVTARNCERSVLNWTFKKFTKDDAAWDNRHFRTTYKQKVYCLLSELKRESSKMVALSLSVTGDKIDVTLKVSPQLSVRLQRKELESVKLAWYTPEVLNPGGPYAQTMLKLREKELMIEANKAKMEEGYVGMFKCGKCKSTKTSYYQLQTRSADEPMTTYVTCTSCGNRWKC